jgi:hypothetical protein
VGDGRGELWEVPFHGILRALWLSDGIDPIRTGVFGSLPLQRPCSCVRCVCRDSSPHDFCRESTHFPYSREARPASPCALDGHFLTIGPERGLQLVSLRRLAHSQPEGLT